MNELSRYRVIFEFEARNERELQMLLSQPDLLRAEAEMRIENVSRRWDLRMAALASPLVIAVVWIGWGIGKAWWGW